jgi:hydrogenase expression/formation protein HypE
MRELIEHHIALALGDVLVDIQNDAACLTNPHPDRELLITTDGFTVKPIEFPGGNIGSLAVHGTINDLAVSGAVPHFLSLNMFIEEGLPFDTLQRLLHSMAQAARSAQVSIACGDTKVVPQGEGSEIYLATTGVGTKPASLQLGLDRIHEGDAVLVSGPVGDHGIAVMLAREQFGLRGKVQSDAASVLPFTRELLDLEGLRFMRDPTRGGLATVLHEIHRSTGMGIRVEQNAIPVRDPVNAVCEMLGYDPMYLACEGRVVAVVDAAIADQALQRWQRLPQGQRAAIIGHINTREGKVVLETELGGQRILEELEDDPLPRIC